MLNRFGVEAKKIAKTGLLEVASTRDGVIIGTIEFYNGAQGSDTAPFVEAVDGGIRLDMSRIATTVTGTLLGREALARDLKFKHSELLWKPVNLAEKTEWILQGGSALTAAASGTIGAVMVGWTDAGDDTIYLEDGNHKGHGEGGVAVRVAPADPLLAPAAAPPKSLRSGCGLRDVRLRNLRFRYAAKCKTASCRLAGRRSQSHSYGFDGLKAACTNDLERWAK